jgi:toxin ParE1/3/4
MRYRLSLQAHHDLMQVRDYIARDKPSAAARTIRSIRDVLRTVISRFPETGAPCEELAPGLRCFPVGNYVVYYRFDKAVDVVRVLHGARDVSAVFRAK